MTDARRLRTDLGLRASGVLLLAIAVTAIHTLVGGHIHDPVRISVRWHRAAR